MRISDWSSDVCSSDLLPLADREAADGVALEADPGKRSGGFGAQLGIDASLHDAEQAVALARHEGLAAAARPAHREPHRGSRSEERRVGKVFVSTGRSRWSPEHKQKTNTRKDTI